MPLKNETKLILVGVLWKVPKRHGNETSGIEDQKRTETISPTAPIKSARIPRKLAVTEWKIYELKLV